MAQAEIGALRVRLAMNAAEFEEGVKKASNRFKRFTRKIGLTSRNIKRGLVAVGAAAGAMAVAVGAAVTATAADFDRLTKASRSIGVPVEQLSAMRHAADLSGAEITDLTKVFRNVARNMFAAAKAPTDFSRSLDELGVQWRETNGQFVRADDLLLRVADRFADMEDGAGKTALAMKIFGEEAGPRMVSMLNSGSAGIQAMTKEARDLGLAFSTEAGKSAERFNDTINRIGKVLINGFQNQLTQKLLPAMELVSNKFLNWATNSGVTQKAAALLSNAMKSLLSVSLRVTHAFESLGLAARTLFENIKDAASLNFSAVEERNRIMNARLSKLRGDLAADLRQIWSDLTEKRKHPAKHAVQAACAWC